MAANAHARVLLVSPHFPPDATAGAHRARVLAPHLAAHGWTPTILTVDPANYEGALDAELAAAFPSSVEVVRCSALPARWTRRVGIGDLGLRALPQLVSAALELVVSRKIDLVYVTTYPIYHSIIGPRVKRKTGARFVLDLQDPWVGAWGAQVGGGPGGTPDAKSKASRMVATRLERLVLPHADALTGVSSALLEELAARYPTVASKPRLALPIGISPHDLSWVATHSSPQPAPSDVFRLCYAGTLLPLGVDIVRALCRALRDARQSAALGDRELRIHFVGTSNQAQPDAASRLDQCAREFDVSAAVSEHPPRVPFFDALRELRAADAVLLLGTTEARYTASKLAAALAVQRPILAVFHEASDVTQTLRPLAAADAGVALIEYGDHFSIDTIAPRITRILETWRRTPPPAPTLALRALQPLLAPVLAERLARLFDEVMVPAYG